MIHQPLTGVHKMDGRNRPLLVPGRRGEVPANNALNLKGLRGDVLKKVRFPHPLPTAGTLRTYFRVLQQSACPTAVNFSVGFVNREEGLIRWVIFSPTISRGLCLNKSAEWLLTYFLASQIGNTVNMSQLDYLFQGAGQFAAQPRCVVFHIGAIPRTFPCPLRSWSSFVASPAPGLRSRISIQNGPCCHPSTFRRRCATRKILSRRGSQ